MHDLLLINERSWTGFNQLSTRDCQEVTRLGYLPVINAPAHEKDTLWTVILRCLQLSQVLNPGQSTVLTLDEQLYAKAKELQWENSEICRGLFLRLGSFHITKNFMSVIGKHFSDSGLQEVWTETSVFGENTAQNSMMAKSYNRAIRAHKLTYEALWTVLWPKFHNWSQQQGLEDNRIQELATRLGGSLARLPEDEAPDTDIYQMLGELEKELEERNVHHLLEEFDKTLPPTSIYWRQYMEMVSVLLQFIRAAPMVCSL